VPGASFRAPLQPIREFIDAALHSDILVIPQAMGIDVEMKPNFVRIYHIPFVMIQDVRT
jgi:uroporphyrinogen decarboxylase